MSPFERNRTKPTEYEWRQMLRRDDFAHWPHVPAPVASQGGEQCPTQAPRHNTAATPCAASEIKSFHEDQ
jgi:hypothetical protein